MRAGVLAAPRTVRDGSACIAGKRQQLYTLDATSRTGPTMRLEVEQRMRHGERFTDVEDVIDISDLPAEEKSALWLLAWSYIHPRAQRREANARLTRLTAATRRTAASSTSGRERSRFPPRQT
jgi:hypothetical protein